MQITRAELGAAIEEAHKRGLKVTGHLCSVTYARGGRSRHRQSRARLPRRDRFRADKQPDVCPGQGARPADDRGARRERRAVQGAREEADRQARRADLHAHRVRDVHAGPPDAAGSRRPHAAAQRAVRADATRAVAQNKQSVYTTLFPEGAWRSSARSSRAGGTLIAGTDPTGGGGVVPGYSNQRQIELLVEAGFTPLEAIQIGTLNGARYPRPRRDASARSPPASRPTSSSSAAIRRRRSPTSGRSRSCSSRASDSTRRS